jgi:hypothetical protein
MSAINVADCSGFLIALLISIQTARSPLHVKLQGKGVGNPVGLPRQPNNYLWRTPSYTRTCLTEAAIPKLLHTPAISCLLLRRSEVHYHSALNSRE